MNSISMILCIVKLDLVIIQIKIIIISIF
jgi:hypothetical protein